MAYNGEADQYLAVWENDTATFDVSAHRVATDAVPFGGDIPVITQGAQPRQFEPDVACSSGSGRCLVVWSDFGSGPVGQTPVIRGRILNRHGSWIGGKFRISGAKATSGVRTAAAAYNAVDDEYLVVFEDYRTGDVTPALYGRLLDADGSRLGGQFKIARGPACNTRRPAVVHNPTRNEYLVVWDDGRMIPGCTGLLGATVYAQRLDGEGSLLGKSFKIIGAADRFVTHPEVAYNSTKDEYLITWFDSRRAGSGESEPVDVFGRRVEVDGTKRSVHRLTRKGASPEWFDGSSVAYGEDSNTYLVVFSDHSGGSGMTRVYGQPVATDGSRQGGDFLVSGSPSFSGGANDVAYNSGRGDYFVVWSDAGSPGGAVYGRRVAE